MANENNPLQPVSLQKKVEVKKASESKKAQLQPAASAVDAAKIAPDVESFVKHYGTTRFNEAQLRDIYTMANNPATQQDTATFQNIDTTGGQIGNTLLGAAKGVENIIKSGFNITPEANNLITEYGISEEDQLAFREYRALEEQAKLETNPLARRALLDDQQRYREQLFTDTQGREDISGGTNIGGLGGFTVDKGRRTKYDVLTQVSDIIDTQAEFNDSNIIPGEVNNLTQDNTVSQLSKTDGAQNLQSSFNNFKEGNFEEGIKQLGSALTDGDTLDLLLQNGDVVTKTFVESVPQMVASIKNAPLGVFTLASQNQKDAYDTFLTEQGRNPTAKEFDNMVLKSTVAAIVGTYSDKALAGLGKPLANTKMSSLLQAPAGAASEYASEVVEGALQQDAAGQDIDLREQHAAGALAAGSGGAISTVGSVGSGIKTAFGSVAQAAQKGAKAQQKTSPVERVIETTAPEVVQTQVEEAVASVPEAERPAVDAALNPYIETVANLQETINRNNTETVSSEGMFEILSSASQVQEEIGRIVADDSIPDSVKDSLADNPTYRAVQDTFFVNSQETTELWGLLEGGELDTTNKAKLDNLATRALFSTNNPNSGINTDGSIDQDYVSAMEEILSRPEYTENMDSGYLDAVRAQVTKLKEMSEVEADVKEGSKDDPYFRGASQYLGAITQAARVGDTEVAAEENTKLQTFAAQHKQKAADARTLYDSLGRNEKKGLFREDGSPYRQLEIKNGKALPIGEPQFIRKSEAGEKFVTQIEAEASYLDAQAQLAEGIVNGTNPFGTISQAQESTVDTTGDSDGTADTAVQTDSQDTESDTGGLDNDNDSGTYEEQGQLQDAEPSGTDTGTDDTFSLSGEERQSDVAEPVSGVGSDDRTDGFVEPVEDVDLNPELDAAIANLAPHSGARKLLELSKEFTEYAYADVYELIDEVATESGADKADIRVAKQALINNESPQFNLDFNKPDTLRELDSTPITVTKEGSDIEKTQRSINVITEYFRRKTAGPISEVADLITRAGQVASEIDLARMLKPYLSVRQVNSFDAETMANLKAFRELVGYDHAKSLQNTFTKIYAEKVAKDRLQYERPYNPLLYLADAEGKLPPTVIDAMVTAGFNWLMYDSKDSAYNDTSQVSRIVGSDGDTGVYNEQLAEAGSTKQTVAEAVGREAFRGLGISLTDNLGGDVDVRLANVLGMTILDVMTDIGYTQENRVSNVDFNYAQQEAGVPAAQWVEADDRKYVSFIKAKADVKQNRMEPTPGTEAFNRLRDTAGKSSRISEKILNRDKRVVTPFINSTPDEYDYHKTYKVRNSDQNVPRGLYKAHNKAIKQKHFMSEGMTNLLMGVLSEEAVKAMLGYDGREGGSDVVQASRDGLNLTIDRDYENAVAMIDRITNEGDLFTTPFSFDYYYANNQRHMMMGDFNIQATKLHRYMTGMDTESYDLSKAKETTFLKLAIGQGLDFEPDKNSNDTVASMVDDLLEGNNPDLNPGFQEMVEYVRSGSLTDEGAIVEAIAEAGEKMHSMKSLLVAAELYVHMETNPNEPFVSDIVLELDGVTNGPFNALVQLGGIADIDTWLEKLNRGGLYRSQTGVKHQDIVAADRTHDTYVAVGQSFLKAFKAYAHELTEDENYIKNVFFKYSAKLLTVENGELTDVARGYQKGTTTQTAYGSGPTANARKSSAQHIEQVYKAIDEKLFEIEESVESKESFDEMIRLVAKIADFYSLTGMSLNKYKGPISDGNIYTRLKLSQQTTNAELFKTLKEFKFRPVENEHIAQQYKKVFGRATDQAISEEMPTITDTQKYVNRMFTVISKLHNARFQSRMKSVTQKGVKAGKVSPLFGMSRKQVRALQGTMQSTAPIMRSPFGLAGNYDEYLHFASVDFEGDTSGKNKLRTITGTQLTYGSPEFGETGASPMPIGNIGVGDGSTAMYLTNNTKTPFLNVWDGYFATPKKMEGFSNQLNTAGWFANSQYDFFDEVVTSYRRAIQNNPIFSDTDATQAEKDAVVAELFSEEYISQDSPFGLLLTEADLHNFLSQAEFRNRAMLDNKNQLKEMDLSYQQFSGVTPVRIEKGTAKSRFKSVRKQAQDKVIKEAQITEQVDDGIKLSAGKYTTDRVKTALRDYRDNQKKNQHGVISSKIVDLLIESLPNNVEVVTDTPIEKWVDADGNKVGFQKDSVGRSIAIQGMNIDNQIFVNPKLLGTPKFEETLIHELIHAATRTAIADFFNGVATERQAEAVRGMRASLVQLAKRDGQLPAALQKVVDMHNANTLGDMEAEFDTLNELLAYGLTNEAAKVYLHKKKPVFWRNVLGSLINNIARLFGFNVRASELVNYVSYMQDLTESTVDTYTDPYTNDNLEPVTYDAPMIDEYVKPSRLKKRRLNSESLNPSMDVQTILESLPRSNNYDLVREAIRDLSDEFLTEMSNKYEVNQGSTVSDQLLADRLDADVKTSVDNVVNVGLMDSQESLAYQLYATVLKEAFKDNVAVAKEVRRLYEKAKDEPAVRTLFPGRGGFINTRAYDAIFNQSEDSVDYLANFAALVRTNKRVRDAVQLSVVTDEINSGDNLLQKVRDGIGRSLETLLAKTADIPLAGTLTQRMDILAKNVVHVKAQKANIVQAGLEHAATVEQYANGLINRAAQKVARASADNTDALPNQIAAPLKLLGQVADGAINDDPRLYQNMMINFATKGKNKRMNAIMSGITEFLGVHSDSEGIHDIRRRRNFAADAAREQLKLATKDVLLEQFNTELTDAQKDTLSKAMLRANMTVFNDGSWENLRAILTTEGGLEAAVDALESTIGSEIQSAGAANFVINQTKGLGYMMATGVPHLKFQLPNSSAIVSEKLTGNDTSHVEASVRELSSLIAFQQMSVEDRTTFLGLLESESSNNYKGLKAISTKVRQLQEEQVSRFGDDSYNVVPDGFVYDILNPHKSLVTGDVNDEKLASLGYTSVGKLPRDLADKENVRKHIMISEDAGVQSWVQGAMSTLEQTLGGYNPVDGRISGKSLPAITDTAAVRDVTNSKLRDIGDLSNGLVELTPQESMVPVINLNGDVQAYQYSLSHEDKDVLLDRVNDFSEILGAWEGRIAEEKTATNFNSELAAELYKNYASETVTSERQKYVIISPNSEDKDIRNAYRLMPDDFRKEIKKHFGTDEFYVHRRDLDNIIGYREKSVVDYWRMDEKDRNAFQKTFVNLANIVMGKNAVRYLRKGERGLQELVAAAKDIIVVKSVIVSAANIISNIAQMHLRGIGWGEMIQNARIGIEGAEDFQRLQKEKYRLEQELAYTDQLDSHTVAKIKSNIHRVITDMQRNPVSELVEAGLMPRIVEDLADSDEFSLRSGLIEKIDKLGDSIPGPLGTFSKNFVFITRDSTTYKYLNKSIEMGDFVAKFAVYQDLRSRPEYQGEEGKQKALRKVAVEFIDYGALQNSEMDYLNKTGMMFFFKYFQRISPIVGGIIRENPARVLGLMLFNQIDLLPVASPLDSVGSDLGAKTGLIDLMRGAFNLPVLNAL